MPLTTTHLTELKSFLPPTSLLLPSDPYYAKETATWAAQRNLSPSLCIRPATLPELQKTVAYLCASNDLDFAVRNGGAGSASSSDVVLSMSAFSDVSFTPESSSTGTATVGAGQTWGQVDLALASLAPDFVCVGTRTPLVGVAGSVLIGGLSWLAHEYGMISDPANLLDAQIVLSSGDCIWAAAEAPDLMWALRGGRFSGGVLAALKFRARKYPTEVFAGVISYPMTALKEVSQRLSAFVHQQHDPRVVCMAFFANPKLSWFPAPESIMLMLYDAHGEAHGRGPEGFEWAFEIEGAMPQVGQMRYCDVGQLQVSAMAGMGASNNHMATLLLPDDGFTEKTLEACYEWFKETITHTVEGIEGPLASGSFIILEQMQPCVFMSVDRDKNETAWPHPRRRTHIVQLGTGYDATHNQFKDAALQKASLKLLAEGCKAANDVYELLKSGNEYQSETSGFTPTFVEHGMMSMEGIYGKENWDRLQDVAARYDPEKIFRDGWKLNGYRSNGIQEA